MEIVHTSKPDEAHDINTAVASMIPQRSNSPRAETDWSGEYRSQGCWRLSLLFHVTFRIVMIYSVSELYTIVCNPGFVVGIFITKLSINRVRSGVQSEENLVHFLQSMTHMNTGLPHRHCPGRRFILLFSRSSVVIFFVHRSRSRSHHSNKFVYSSRMISMLCDRKIVMIDFDFR